MCKSDVLLLIANKKHHDHKTIQQSDAASEEPSSEQSLASKAFEIYTKTANAATTLFPLWTVLFTAIALKKPSTFDFFTTEYFTAALAALMLSMGITLTPADFVAVASEPSSVLMQFSLCYGMMPLLAMGLGKMFGLDAGLMAGMVLVGSINGGQASNLCTYIAKGNVALSVLMTTATTVGAILMTPFLCKSMLGAVVPVDARGIAMSTIQVSLGEGCPNECAGEIVVVFHVPKCGPNAFSPPMLCNRVLGRPCTHCYWNDSQ